MPTVKVIIDLPFFLRLERPMTVRYEEVCRESQVSELMGQDVQVTVSRRPADGIDKSKEVTHQRSTVAIRVETTAQLPEASVGTFAIRNCLDILNELIISYQAVTGETGNAGFIFSLGTSDMQLYADIRVDGADIRDRWPFHNMNTIPLSEDEFKELERYFTNREEVPLPKLLLTSARSLMERGQYPLAVLQAAAAVELRTTMVISERLKSAGWSEKTIDKYERMTLGPKLQIACPDPRSIETYLNGVSGFDATYRGVKDIVMPIRNRIAHRGYLASHEEASKSVALAGRFIELIN